MKKSRLLLFSILIVSALVSVSCGDDDNTETLPYLTGSPKFEFPSFSTPNTVLEITASGVTDDDGNEAEYFWYPSYATSEKDTTKTYTLRMPNDFTTISITCTAFKEGYYSTSTTKAVTIVSEDRENGSLTGRDFDFEKDFVFTDPRDGREYWCTRVGDTEWFRDNLAYAGSGISIYDDCSDLAGIFGIYYNWNEAMEACPEGWRLASLDDWAKAAKVAGAEDADSFASLASVAGAFMGDIKFNQEAMWEYWPNVKITNKLRLDITPCGYVILDTEGDKNKFQGMLEYASFWTSDSKDDDLAYYRYFYEDKADIMLGSGSKESFGASVRCVRDVK